MFCGQMGSPQKRMLASPFSLGMATMLLMIFFEDNHCCTALAGFKKKFIFLWRTELFCAARVRVAGIIVIISER